MNELGNAVRERRKGRYTQAALAQALKDIGVEKVSTTMISNIERGAQKPPEAVLDALGGVLDTDFREIVRETPPDIADIRDVLRQAGLSPAAREMVTGLSEYLLDIQRRLERLEARRAS